jgi:hypothetical protein
MARLSAPLLKWLGNPESLPRERAHSLSVPFNPTIEQFIVCGEQLYRRAVRRNVLAEVWGVVAVMWLSTLWVGISVALSTGGHPATAVLPLAAWIAHRRMEKRAFGRVNNVRKDLQIGKAIRRDGT